MAQRLNLKESAATAIVDEAGIEADFGYRAEAVKGATAALAISRSPDVLYSAARTLALAGEANKAETLIAELAERRPADVIVGSVEAPEVRAINAMNRGNLAKAIELLQAATPYEGRLWGVGVRSTRGNAYLKAGRGKEAAQEFQKILATAPSLVVSIRIPNSALVSTAQLGLARAYALQGDKAKSRMAYQDFLALWKDADPDIPILKEAKAEYARLQ
jgi:predicted Zn-dependent protease